MSQKNKVIFIKNQLPDLRHQFDEVSSLGPINDTRMIEARADLIRCSKKLETIINSLTKQEESKNGSADNS